MDKETFRALNQGDIIEYKMRSETYVVTMAFEDRVTAVTSVDVTNPDEWDLVLKASYSKPICRNCQEPKPGKMVYVVDRGGVMYCRDCGRLMFPKEEEP